jgi:modulator of FtsH protease
MANDFGNNFGANSGTGQNGYGNGYGQGGGILDAHSRAISQNKVLRNTYWLLALSLVPTVLGAVIGVKTGFNALFAGSPWISALVFLGGAFAFMFAIERYKNSAAGVGILLAFTFFMGLMLSRLIGAILGFSNGATLIATAFGGTAAIFAVMASIATVSKRDFSGMGKWLTIGAVLILIAGLLNIWLKLPALMLGLSVLCMALFSAFMLYDVQRVVNGGETNYVSATLAIYLDIYNVFSSLLSILGIAGGERD